MSRFTLAVLGVFSLALGAACSGGAKGGNGTAERSTADDGSGTDVANGSAGSAGSAANSAGNAAENDNAAGGSSASSGATYTAAQACQRFAQAVCAKGEECGLRLAQAAGVCVNCDAFTVAVLEQACAQQAPGDKDAAAVDRCLSNFSAKACADACVNPNADGCDTLGQLPTDQLQNLTCDPSCVTSP